MFAVFGKASRKAPKPNAGSNSEEEPPSSTQRVMNRATAGGVKNCP